MNKARYQELRARCSQPAFPTKEPSDNLLARIQLFHADDPRPECQEVMAEINRRKAQRIAASERYNEAGGTSSALLTAALAAIDEGG